MCLSDFCDTVVDNIAIIHQQNTVLPSIKHTALHVCIINLIDEVAVTLEGVYFTLAFIILTSPSLRIISFQF